MWSCNLWLSKRRVWLSFVPGILWWFNWACSWRFYVHCDHHSLWNEASVFHVRALFVLWCRKCLKNGVFLQWAHQIVYICPNEGNREVLGLEFSLPLWSSFQNMCGWTFRRFQISHSSWIVCGDNNDNMILEYKNLYQSNTNNDHLLRSKMVFMTPTCTFV